MTKLTSAAAFVESEILVSRDLDEDTRLDVAGFVVWNPVKQAFDVYGVRVTETATWKPDGPSRPELGDYEKDGNGGELRGEREAERAKEALISAAEQEHVGECIACQLEWGPRQKADGVDCLCREHRQKFERKAA